MRPKGSGKTPGSGRKRGTVNKVTASLKDMILQALDGVGGVGYLEAVALENPAAFAALIGRVLPLQVTGDGGGPVAVTVVHQHLLSEPDALAIEPSDSARKLLT